MVYGPDGLRAGMKPGSVIVDCSTSDPVSTARMVEDLKTADIDFIDAPLSRTPKEAWEGKLDTMVGASDAVFARVKPILDTWAGKVVHIGGPGDGHRMKLLNNFVSLGYAALYAEALALSRKVGIAPERFDSVIRGGRMDCGFYQTFSRWTLEGDPDAHKFSIANAYKDLRYLASMANAAGVPGPMGDAVKNSFALAHGAGGAGDYVPMLASYVAHGAGIDDGLVRQAAVEGEAVIACRSVLVFGGARSGKSGYALSLAEATAPERVMIATAQAFDEEMEARIAAHRQERGVGWTTRETPLDLVGALVEEARPGRVVLVDCITLWLSNLMLAERDLEAAVAELAAARLEGPVVFVSNEVGQGVVPPSKMGRQFQDAQGRANQALARACDAVVQVAAGLPRLLKPAPAFELRLG